MKTPLAGPSESGYHFMQDYRNCNQAWGWKYYHNLEPMHVSPTLLYGIAMHRAMGEWYTALFAGSDAEHRLELATIEFIVAMDEYKEYYVYESYRTDDINKGVVILQNYAVRYSQEQLKILAPNGAPAIEASLSRTLPSGDKITGRIDLAATLYPAAARFIIDHKTTGWSLDNVVRTYQVSQQSVAYVWLWNSTYPELHVQGVIYNVLRYYRGKTDYVQVPVYCTDADIDKFVTDSQETLDDIARKVGRNNPNFIRNSDSCYRFNKPCPFLELCNGEQLESLIGIKYKYKEEEEI